MADLTVVYPTKRNAKGPGHDAPATSGEVGWFVKMPERYCAFCKIGCCIQRMIVDMSAEPIVVHAMLGEA